VFTHDIYRNVRTRVIIVRNGKMLLHAPFDDRTGRHAYRCLPGGGLRPNESLYECGEREVLEETGLRVKVTSVAFLRECVVPKCVSAEEMKRTLRTWEGVMQAVGYQEAVDQGSREPAGHAYALEVYLWAHLCDGEAGEAKPDDILGAVPQWLPLEQVAREPLFPTELKALARDLSEGREPVGVPSFVTGLGDPWDEPDWEAFRRG